MIFLYIFFKFTYNYYLWKCLLFNIFFSRFKHYNNIIIIVLTMTNTFCVSLVYTEISQPGIKNNFSKCIPLNIIIIIFIFSLRNNLLHLMNNKYKWLTWRMHILILIIYLTNKNRLYRYLLLIPNMLAIISYREIRHKYTDLLLYYYITVYSYIVSVLHCVRPS